MLLFNKKFFYAGRLMENSILQGGPSPCFLAPWCYNIIMANRASLPCDVTVSVTFIDTTDMKKSMFTKLANKYFMLVYLAVVV